MRLPNKILEKLKNKGIEVFYADRWIVQFWNERRSEGDLRLYCGWYWWIDQGSGASWDHGPFNSQMAACRDAYYECQLKWAD